MAVVNQGACRDFLARNTIDPIAFLESGKIAVPGTATKEVVESVQNRPVKVVERTNMKTRAQIQEEEIQEFLKENSLSFGLSEAGTNVPVGGSVTTFVASGDRRGKSTRGNLPESGLDIVFDHAGLSVFPEKIVALDGGRREFRITGKKPGAYEIAFKMGQTVVARRTVVVLTPTDAQTVATADIRTPSKVLLGEDKELLVVMRTRYGTPMTDARYAGKFKLSAIRGKAKFCNASLDPKTACRSENLVEELVFGAEETYRGVLKARIRTYSFAPVALQVTRLDGNKSVLVSKTNRDLPIGNPKGIDSSYAYYREAISALEKGWFPLKDGFLLQDRELTGAQAKELVRRYLGYRWLKAGNDFGKKKSIGAAILRFERDFGKSDDYARITRGQLADLLLGGKGVPYAAETPDRGFTDETGTWKSAVRTMRITFGFKWQDQFGERYFQPDKNVTVGEALYLAEKIGP